MSWSYVQLMLYALQYALTPLKVTGITKAYLDDVITGTGEAKLVIEASDAVYVIFR